MNDLDKRTCEIYKSWYHTSDAPLEVVYKLWGNTFNYALTRNRLAWNDFINEFCRFLKIDKLAEYLNKLLKGK